MPFVKCLISILISCPLMAQSGLYLSADKGQKFRVSLNNYAQEVSYRERILISKLDTGNQQLYLKLKDTTVVLSRSIRIPGKENYHYCITQNYRGQYRIRYRGAIRKIPSPTINWAYSRNVRWPQKEPTSEENSKLQWPAPKNPPPSDSSLAKNSTVKAHNKTEKSPGKTAKRSPKSSNQQTSMPARDPGKVTLLPRNTDSVPGKTEIRKNSIPRNAEKNLEEPSKESSPKGTGGSSLAEVLEQLQKLQYESEKRQYLEEQFHPELARPESLLAIFKHLKYDQTRLELTNAFKQSILQYENWREILAGFQYEISKNKAQKMLQ